MQLRSSPSSPFGRKVKMATFILGFDDQVTRVLTDTLDPNDSICEVNPLGKIPALEDGGTTFYDSRVIIEYFDAKAGGGKLEGAVYSGLMASLCLRIRANPRQCVVWKGNDSYECG